MFNITRETIEEIFTKSPEVLAKFCETILKQSGYKILMNNDEFLYAVPTNKKGTVVPICMVAHFDTVYKTPREHIEILYDDKRRAAYAFYGGLGADDRAGIMGILQIVLETKYRPHILFCHEEERGGIGAEAAGKYLKELQGDGPLGFDFLVEIDREANGEAVFYDVITPEFIKHITNFGFVEKTGSFSDISFISPEIKLNSVNLSAGYYNQHSELGEIFSVDDLEQTLVRVLQIFEYQLRVNPKFNYEEEESHYSSYKKYYKSAYSKDFNFIDPKKGEYCDICGTTGEVDCLGQDQLNMCEKCQIKYVRRCACGEKVITWGDTTGAEVECIACTLKKWDLP